jgi:amino acid adenylation domain-containing protein
MAETAGAYPVVARLLALGREWRERPMMAAADGAVSYAAMTERMLRIASWLKHEAAVLPGDRVALCLPKSLGSVQLIYGLIAAGAAYVPLQYLGPVERLAAILNAVQPRLLVTTTAMGARLEAAIGPGSLPPMLQLNESGDLGLDQLLHSVVAAPGISPADPDSLALVIFTSGSTGEPKGVMLSHRDLAANLDGLQRRDGLTGADLRISHAGLHYVASIDIFFPLAGGCRLFLLSERETMFADRIASAIEQQRATLWSSTATVMRLLLEQGDLERRDLSAVRRVAIYGEALPLPLLRRLMAIFPQAQFCNHYGATEAYNMANFIFPRPLPEDLDALPLGRAPDHCILSLRDEAGEEVAPGELGEICAAGPMVALGYWGDPDLSRAKGLGPGGGFYRSGDLGRIGDDGLLHFAGRADDMVKLRGQRFQLSEIEAVLQSHPAVRKAIALAIEAPGREPEIRAALLAEGGGTLEAELRALCARRLPTRARPTLIVVLDRFPTTATGKLDRMGLKALLERGRPDEGAAPT